LISLHLQDPAVHEVVDFPHLLVIVTTAVEANEVVINGIWLGILQESFLAHPNAIAPLIVPAPGCGQIWFL